MSTDRAGKLTGIRTQTGIQITSIFDFLPRQKAKKANPILRENSNNTLARFSNKIIAIEICNTSGDIASAKNDFGKSSSLVTKDST